VRASTVASGSDDRLIVDLRGRMETSEDAECDLMENGLRDFFGFDASCDGMSEGTQRTPGRKVRSLDFMITVVATSVTSVSSPSHSEAHVAVKPKR
jgi:hypothetical protein